MLTRGHTIFSPMGQDAPRFPHVTGDEVYDVIVVGAGITGLTAARLLGRGGLRVALVEARRLGSGTTAFSTGHLTQLVDAGYRQIEKDFGEDGAKRVAESTRFALEFVADTVARESISCEFRRVAAYLFAEQADEIEAVQDEFHTARRAGVAASFVERAPLPFDTLGAVRVEDQAEFDPSAYVQGLARNLPANVKLFESSHVVSIDEGATFEVRCEHGTLRAPHVLDATHVPLGRHLLDARTAPYRSYVIAVRTQSPVPVGIFWDTRDPYHYIRSQKDIVMVGGADHKTGQTDDGLAHYDELTKYVEARFTGAEVVARWTSEYYVPVDGLPFIGEMTPGGRRWVATGFDGDGLIFGTLAGNMLADAILGKESPYADLYTPSRVKPLASAGLFLRESANVAYHMVADRLASAPKDSVEDIPADAGRIVDIKGHRCAVYRDGGGEVHVRSAVCPHAGGIVQWNSASHTWDCPLHGGCFSPTGVVLGGPPPGDLKPPPE